MVMQEQPARRPKIWQSYRLSEGPFQFTTLLYSSKHNLCRWI